MKLAKNLERLGTETAFSVLAEAKKLEAQGKEMIHLGLGQPDFMTPKHIMDAAKKAIDDGHHGYVLANGIAECRQAVSRKIKKLYKSLYINYPMKILKKFKDQNISMFYPSSIYVNEKKNKDSVILYFYSTNMMPLLQEIEKKIHFKISKNQNFIEYSNLGFKYLVSISKIIKTCKTSGMILANKVLLLVVSKENTTKTMA